MIIINRFKRFWLKRGTFCLLCLSMVSLFALNGVLQYVQVAEAFSTVPNKNAIVPENIITNINPKDESKVDPKITLISTETNNVIDIVNPVEGNGWVVDENDNVTITKNGEYVIKGKGTTTNNLIAVEPNLTVKIILDNVIIVKGKTGAGYYYGDTALHFGSNCNFTVEFRGENTLRTSIDSRWRDSDIGAAIFVEPGSIGIFESPYGGKLTCEGMGGITVANAKVTFTGGTLVCTSSSKGYAAIGMSVMRSGCNSNLHFTGNVNVKCSGIGYGPGIGFQGTEASSITIDGDARIEAYGGYWWREI